MKQVIRLLPLALALILTACGSTSTNQDKAEMTEVSVSVAFADLKPSFQTLAVPGDATKAIVTIFDSSSDEVATLALTESNREATARLEVGAEYTFVASVQNKDSVELAWGRTIKTVQAADTVTIEPRSIISSVRFGPATYNGEIVTLPLEVLGPTGSRVPFKDIEISYEIEGATKDSESSFALFLIPDSPDGTIRVDATVEGLREDHTTTSPFVVNKEFSASSLDAGEPFIISAPISNWAYDSTWIDVQAVAYVPHFGWTPVAHGSIDETGHLDLILPGGDELLNAGLLRPFDESTVYRDPTDTERCTINWTVEPHDFLLTRVDAIAAYQLMGQPSYRSHYEDDVYNVGLYYSTTAHGRYHPSYWYVPEPVYAEGMATCGSDAVRISVDLEPGWNLVEVGYGITSHSWDPPSSEGEYEWRLFEQLLRRQVDVAVDTSVSTSRPAVGEVFTVTATVYPDTSEHSRIISRLDFPEGITVTDVRRSGRHGEWPYYSHTLPNALEIEDSLTTGNNPVTYQISLKTSADTADVQQELVWTTATNGHFDIDLSNNSSEIVVTPSMTSAGNTPVEIDIDFAAPSVSFNDPASSVELGRTKELSGTATDDNSVDSIEIFEDSRFIGNATLDHNNWTFTWTPSKAGLRTIKAIAFDEAGNQGVAQRIFQVVD